METKNITKEKEQINIDELSPYKLSTEVRVQLEKKVMNLYQTDRELYDRANKLVKQLGLGGLWRGQEACVLIVANAIKKEEN